MKELTNAQEKYAFIIINSISLKIPLKKKGNKNHWEVRERETIFVGLDLTRGCHLKGTGLSLVKVIQRVRESQHQRPPKAPYEDGGGHLQETQVDSRC